MSDRYRLVIVFEAESKAEMKDQVDEALEAFYEYHDHYVESVPEGDKPQ